MAFGFFKKNLAADLVLKNGKIITQDANLPQVEAVACKDGKIAAVGSCEDIEIFINKETQVTDLQGKYAVPGFTSLWDSPALKVFRDKYLDLTGCNSKDELLSLISSWKALHEDSDIIFGFGYNEGIFEEDLLHDISAMSGFLDLACPDKPAVFLCRNNISCIYNSQAAQIINQTAEEEMVQYITTPYILNLLIPFDFEEIEQDVSESMMKNAQRGITSVLSLGAPDYFESIYRDCLISLYNENLLCQRFFSSYYINRPVLPKNLIHQLMQMKTTCNEIGDFFNAKLLLVILDGESCPMDFSQKALNTILEQVADKGFDIYLQAKDKTDLEKAYMACEHVRGKGYRVMLAVETSDNLPDDMKKELMYSDSIFCISREFKDEQWQNASLIINCSDKLGTIEIGKFADIAVFESNPYQRTCDGLPEEKAVMTIINGIVVYQ